MSSAVEQTMSAIVITPEMVLWEGAVSAVAGTNSEGPFSILPDHTRFITIILNEPVIFHLPDKKIKEFTYNKAVLVVDNNVVTIYVHTTESIDFE